MKYWFKYRFDWMRVYNSPFKPIIPKLYIGKVAIGTPYFFPRVWVKATPKLAHEATKKHIEREEAFNKSNPQYARKIKSYNDIFEDKMNGSYPVPKKIGFDFVGLGWKTKWKNTDYRFEWNPLWSFVFFGYQIAITFVPIEPHHYWECWLYYSRETKGTTKERIEQSRKEFPCVWISTKNGVETKTCYWDVILKNKYL